MKISDHKFNVKFELQNISNIFENFFNEFKSQQIKKLQNLKDDLKQKVQYTKFNSEENFNLEKIYFLIKLCNNYSDKKIK